MTSEANPISRAPMPETLVAAASTNNVAVAAPPLRYVEALAQGARWIFSFPAMLGALLVAGAFLRIRMFIVDPDVWWHIRVGRIVLETRHFPDGDPFSFTVLGHFWMACEWLGDVLLAAVHKIGGLQALDVLYLVLGAATVVSLYILATIRSKKSKAGFLATTALLPLAVLPFNLRPQMLGYLFLILTVIALELFRQGHHRAIWFLPPLFLVWVNAHGSFPIGLGAIGLYWICGWRNFQSGRLVAKAWTPKERLSLSAVLLLCFATLPLTPYGTRLAAYPYEVAFNLPLGVARVQEWRPMPFDELGGKIFLGLLFTFLVAQIAYDFEWRLEEIGLFLFGALMACLHVRFLLIFVPFFVPLLAVVFGRWTTVYDRRKDHYVLNAVIIASVLLGLWHFFPSRAELDQIVANSFPVDAVAYMKKNPVPDPMYNTYGFGGYLIYSRWPEHKVFIDGRADPFERAGVFTDYVYISELHPGALTILDRYGIKSCLIQGDEYLGSALLASGQWKRVYADRLSALFVRRDSLAPTQNSNLPDADSVAGGKN